MMVKEHLPVLYVNILIHDASEVIKAKINKRISKGSLPKPIRNIIAPGAAELASNVASSSAVAEMMSKKMSQRLPEKMKEKGLTAWMGEVFRKGPYFVLELQIQHVDMITLEKVKREEGSGRTDSDPDSTGQSWLGTLLDCFLSLIGAGNQKILEGDFLPRQVHRILQTEMEEMMEKKFEEKQLIADVQILREEKQARFCYKIVGELQEAKKEMVKKNLLKSIEHDFKMKISEEMDDPDDFTF